MSALLESRLNFQVEEEPVEETKQPSDATSSRISSVEDDHGEITLVRPRKRKRSIVEFHYLNGQKSGRKATPGDPLTPEYLASSPESSPQPMNQSEKWNNSGESSQGEDRGLERDIHDVQEISKVKAKQGKRKARKASGDEADTQSPRVMSVVRSGEPLPDRGAPDTNPDDVELEDSGEYAGSDNVNRDEETSKFRKCFNFTWYTDELTSKPRYKERVCDAIVKCHGKMFYKLKREVRQANRANRANRDTDFRLGCSTSD